MTDSDYPQDAEPTDTPNEALGGIMIVFFVLALAVSVGFFAGLLIAHRDTQALLEQERLAATRLLDQYRQDALEQQETIHDLEQQLRGGSALSPDVDLSNVIALHLDGDLKYGGVQWGPLSGRPGVEINDNNDELGEILRIPVCDLPHVLELAEALALSPEAQAIDYLAADLVNRWLMAEIDETQPEALETVSALLLTLWSPGCAGTA